MAAGEYVSVSSQADSEAADLARVRQALEEAPKAEMHELEQIYVDRGLTPALAGQVAEQLTAKDALSAHARDELGLAEGAEAKPTVAAFTSAIAFSAVAALPTLAAFLSPKESLGVVVPVAALIFLAALGALGAWMGGALIGRPTVRVAF